MELIEIVDNKGNFTGEIIDKDIAHDNNLLHNEVGIFILNNKKQVLLQKRSSSKRFNPNMWGLCAGHVQAKESLESAALREVQEEVGLALTEKDLIFIDREFTMLETNSHVSYFFYVVSNLVESGFIIQEEELSEVKWFDIEEVMKEIKNESSLFTFKKQRLKVFEKVLHIAKEIENCNI